MGVYKEGYSIIENISKWSKAVFADAADYGCPVKKDSYLWDDIKQLAEWYGRSEINPNLEVYKKDWGGYFDICLGSDDSDNPSQRFFRVEYNLLKDFQKKPYLNEDFKGAHGFVTVYEMKKPPKKYVS